MGRKLYTASEKMVAKANFLGALCEGKPIQEAAACAGVHFRSFYRWREEDAAFKGGWEKAVGTKMDDLEIEALRRAVKGVEKPVYRGGELVGHITDYSDSMLMFLLKAHHPEKYDPKSIETKKSASAEKQANIQDVEGALDALKRKFAEVTQPRKKKPIFWNAD